MFMCLCRKSPPITLMARGKPPHLPRISYPIFFSLNFKLISLSSYDLFLEQ
uniref:Uncharacterized protein n=1 Tax=Arundo donax TaxID=35708 RepID=A0A0A8ZD69_ARUDO